MTQESLRRLMREAGSISGVYLRIDASQEASLYERLKRTPVVAGVLLKRAAVQSFQETIAQNMNTMILFNVLFAALIAGGVVYNASRIILSERSRDLASLRVLGFTRHEVSAILLGELAVIVLCALPVGLVLGQGLGAMVIWATDSELYRFPLIVTARTRLFAVTVVTLSAIISGLIVRRRVDKLDLVGVLRSGSSGETGRYRLSGLVTSTCGVSVVVRRRRVSVAGAIGGRSRSGDRGARPDEGHG